MSGNLSPSFGVLLIDDEVSFLRSFSLLLETAAGINHLYTCDDSRQAMDLIDKHCIGLVLLDINMPHLSGESLLSEIVAKHPEIHVIIVSGLNQLETAMNCIRLGAFDYFIKSSEENRLIDGIKRAIEMQEMRLENQEMRRLFFSDTLKHPEAFTNILTQDKNMKLVFQYLESVAESSRHVLITGESGTGKEAIAQAIHDLSGRKGSLVSVNVAGVDDSFFSDTLFGHARGAFSGADQARSGMVEQANGGTLFLDEIGDLSLASQVKLLRLLQEGEYYPLGSDTAKRLDARLVVATHQNLDAKQADGSFRKDLYYRLCTHQVELPALRKRPADIPLLLEYFLEKAAEELGRSKPTVPKELLVLLQNYAFPGNVRELQALCFDAVSRHRGGILSMAVFKRACENTDTASLSDMTDAFYQYPDDFPLPTLQKSADLLVDEAMKRANGNQSVASRLLGISQPALSKRLKSRKGADTPSE
ncbi:sigma-54-dependent transcriptional regulator [Marinomonas pollencensis]|uniref:Two component Fis family sigma54 specific transcriptional regulator n=1 Tax=Marinomonas pollencensis TaxID=491954 RepID=A0A3E0DQ12_9GAMM|nr:sigma-54 dependent transcriptional regulator [Marinomonas pollencensis]REG85047.1 two component Fis family sigma54 specific transcriptional regulator [Marinomonas pollencensis]